MKSITALCTLILSVHLIAYGTVSIQNIASSYEIEYENKEDCYSFHEHLQNAWRVSNLENGKTYTMKFCDPESTDFYDEVLMTSKYMLTYWEVVDDENKYLPEWKWNGPNGGVDTFHIQVYIDDYSDIEVGMVDYIWFGMQDGFSHPWGVTIVTEIVTSMSASGPSYDCYNPVQYTLNNLNLANGGSASWVIKQSGYTKASGTGTTATASNISNGAAYAQFTVSFLCGLNSLTFTKNFWFGKPGQPTTNPSGYPTVQMSLGEMKVIHVASGPGATNYSWNATGSITRISGQTGPTMTVEATSLGNGNFYCYGTNICGTSNPGGGSVYVSYGGGQMRVSPNPANTEIEIIFDDDQQIAEELMKAGNSQNSKGNVYFRLIDKFGEVKLTQLYMGEKQVKINVSQLPIGLYTVQLVIKDKLYSTNIMINR